MSFSSNYNIQSKFNTVGSFKISQKNIPDLKASGIIKLQHGYIYLTLFGYENRNSYYHQCLKSSNNFSINGILSDGKGVNCKKFNLITSTFNDRTNNKIYYVDKFLVYELILKDPKIPLSENNNYNFGINIEQLLYWGYYPGLLSDTNNPFENDRYSLPLILFNNNKIYSCISYYNQPHNGMYSNSVSKRAVLNVKIKEQISNKDILDFAKEFCKLIELLTNMNLSLLNISMKHLDCSCNYLYSTSIKPPHVHYQWMNGTLSLTHICKTMGQNGFAKIFKKFMEKPSNLAQLVNALLNKYYISNSELTNLMNYTNGIESYYKNSKYPSNNKQIKKLSDKLYILFIDRMPNDIKLIILHTTNNNNLKRFSIQIANTRNNYVHSKHKFTALKGLDLVVAVKKLYWLIYYFILVKIGLPRHLVYLFIKININGTLKSDYL